MKHPIINEYYKILSPEFPEFLIPYLQLPLLRRLDGIGLLCGTDWTALYQNKFFYSRLDHSVGVALIIWHFTKDRAQTLAGLLHDISTPVFSHVMDFRNNDALTQESTEEGNATMICKDEALKALLKKDGISVESVIDYHQYPVADNKLPRLSADRLEYMFTTGMIMKGIWNLEEIETTYRDLKLMTNESGETEIGFTTQSLAIDYCRKCCETGLIMVENENILTLSRLARLSEMAIQKNMLEEADFYRLSEKAVITLFSEIEDREFRQYFQTFCKMQEIIRADSVIEDSYCVCLAVKRRYIDPLWEGKRISVISADVKQMIHSFLSFRDSAYAGVRLLK
ncbi:MAG: HD domain-containing protein [Bacteroidales bacterium]